MAGIAKTTLTATVEIDVFETLLKKLTKQKQKRLNPEQEAYVRNILSQLGSNNESISLGNFKTLLEVFGLIDHSIPNEVESKEAASASAETLITTELSETEKAFVTSMPEQDREYGLFLLGRAKIRTLRIGNLSIFDFRRDFSMGSRYAGIFFPDLKDFNINTAISKCPELRKQFELSHDMVLKYLGLHWNYSSGKIWEPAELAENTTRKLPPWIISNMLRCLMAAGSVDRARATVNHFAEGNRQFVNRDAYIGMWKEIVA